MATYGRTKNQPVAPGLKGMGRRLTIDNLFQGNLSELEE